MNHELITHVPVFKEANDFDGEVPVHVQSTEQSLGAVALINAVPGVEVDRMTLEPGAVVSENTDRIVAIEDQANVTANPETVPGTDAYAAKQERIANDLRSNKLY